MLKKAKYWVKLCYFTHHPIFVGSAILGAVIAWSEGYDIRLTVASACLIAYIITITACRLSKEYFDYEWDKRIPKEYVFRDMGSRVLIKGFISRRQAIIASCILFIIAFTFWIFIQLYLGTGIGTVPLAILGAWLFYAYTGEPFRFERRECVGEIGPTIGNGMVAPLAGYYVFAHGLSWIPIVCSLPWLVGMFSFKIMVILGLWEPDRIAGAKFFAYRLGKERIAYLHIVLASIMYALAFFIPFILFNVPIFCFLPLVLPAFFTSRIIKGLYERQWKDREGSRRIFHNAIAGMTTTPLALIGIFTLKSLVLVGAGRII